MKSKVTIILIITLALLALACMSPQYEHLKKGDDYSENGKWNEAIIEYTKAIELAPSLIEAYNNRATAYIEKGEYDKAIDDCTKAIEIDPQSTIPYYNRSIVYLHKGQYEKAIDDCDKIIEMGLNSPWVYYHRGMAYFEMGFYKAAIGDFTRARNISTTSSFLQMIDQRIKNAEDMLNKTKQQ